MTERAHPLSRFLLGAAVALAGLAAVVPPVLADRPVELDLATVEVPEELLLDVAVVVFDPNIPEKIGDDFDRVRPDVRRSEARYLPYHLKTTLERTGWWGAVRVVPEASDGADLYVSGRIDESFGRKLVVDIKAEDATGRIWIDDRYKEKVEEIPSLDDQDASAWPRDFFQELFNEIANDLLQERRRLSDDEILEIRRVARLRFARQVAPAVFDGYLERGRRGHWEIRRLPAEDDPMMERVERVRQRDYMLVDTLNEHYGQLYARMAGSYDEWRHHALTELEAFKKVRRKARWRKVLGGLLIAGAVLGGAEGEISGSAAEAGVLAGGMVVHSGIQKGREARIHREALHELAASFEREVEPMVVEVEGEVVRLQGSAEEQFSAWRELLHRIFQEETGLPLDEDAGGSSEEG